MLPLRQFDANTLGLFGFFEFFLGASCLLICGASRTRVVLLN